MKDERWGEILDKILERFEIIERSQEQDGVAEVETIVFVSPLGKVKLIHTVRPAILDKKVTGAHRRGKSGAQYEYIYSTTDMVNLLEAYREVDGEWQKIDADLLA